MGWGKKEVLKLEKPNLPQARHPAEIENDELKDLIRRFNVLTYDNTYSALGGGYLFKWHVERLEKAAEERKELAEFSDKLKKVLTGEPNPIIDKVQQILTERGYLPKGKK
jgi:hypothetical protein